MDGNRRDAAGIRLAMERSIRSELEMIRDATAACTVALATGDGEQVLEILRERQTHMSRIDGIQAERIRLMAEFPISVLKESPEWNDVIVQEADNRRLLQDIVELDRTVRQQADEWNQNCRADLRELRTRRYIQEYEREIIPSSLYVDIRG